MEIPTINLFIPDGPGGSPHTTIQSAVDAAHQSPGGSVWIPASYIGTDSYTNSNNVPIFDMRGTGSVSFASSGGTPGGSTGDIQFNNAGVFANAADINASATAGMSSDGNMGMVSPGSFSFTSTASFVSFEAVQNVNLISDGADITLEADQSVTVTSDNAGISFTASSGFIGFNAASYNLNLAGLPIFANNAAAISGGLGSGDFYRTGADPDVVCVVH